MNNIKIRKAEISDLDTLVELRLAYLHEDLGKLSAVTEEMIITQLKEYITKHINDIFTAFFAETDGKVVSTAFMAIADRPANPFMMTGRTALVQNVFTYPEHRRRGIATLVLKELIAEAKRQNVSYIELSATADGKPVYQKLGFVEKQSRYTEMKLKLIEEKF
jgi:GNAT superfamily N-acetyltransferase